MLADDFSPVVRLKPGADTRRAHQPREGTLKSLPRRQPVAVHAPTGRSLFVASVMFARQLKTHPLASGREIDAVQDQGQLRASDFKGLLFCE